MLPCRTLTQLIFPMLLSDVCGIFLLFFFSFFPAASAPSPPALVCCRFHCFGADGASLFCLNFTTPFLFPEPHTVWHPPTCSISSPRSSSFSLSGAVREPLLPFPFVSSPGPFYRGCFYPPGLFFFFCSNFWPFRPGILSSLLSTAWFHLEWSTFLVSQDVLVGVKVFSLQTRTDSPLFEDLVLLQNESLCEVYQGKVPWTSLEHSSRGLQVCGILSWPFSFPSAIIAVIVIARSFNSCRRQHSPRPLNGSRRDNYAHDLNRMNSSHCGTKQKLCCWKIESRSSVKLFNDFHWRNCWRRLFGWTNQGKTCWV